jgi:hypothetical protein
VFTLDTRDSLRAELLAAASVEPRISGGAITGSAAATCEDKWSDIDLAFGVADPKDMPHVIADSTERMYERYGALHHVDVSAGAWLYRVFLLANGLQVDLAFAPAAEFGALAPTFKLMFGEANKPKRGESRPIGDLIGWGWLYALHARSCIAREKVWQAEYMISALRDTALALACVRHGLPSVHGRGMDALPTAVTVEFAHALVRRLNHEELLRAFRIAVEGLLSEIEKADADLAGKLKKPLTELLEVT